MKATVTTIPFGFATVQGLLMPDGSFGIALTQAWLLIDEKIARQKNELRQAKSLLGKNFTPVKVATELNVNKAYVLTLPEFELFLAKADRAGYKNAQDLRDSLVGLSLHQLFCDAFGIKFEAEERQQWLTVRQQSKALFWEFSQAISDWIANRECSSPEFTYYSNAYDAINLGLFGKKSKQIKEELGKPELNRNCLGSHSLRRIITIQEASARYLRSGRAAKPTEAVKQVSENLMEEQFNCKYILN